MISIGSASHGRARRLHLRLDDGFECFKGERPDARQGSQPLDWVRSLNDFNIAPEN
jgi:hypothetical protein